MTPSAYVKRNCYGTLEADEVPSALRMALEELGEDHFLMATDYPIALWSGDRFLSLAAAGST
jgi:predicted TIM-barrel fold metal-dependent hydrolase